MQKNWYNKLSQLTDWAIIIKSPLSHDAHRSIIVLRKMFQKSTLTSTLINFPKMSYWVLCRVSPALLSCLSFRSQIGSRTASYKLQESQAGKLNCGIWTGSTGSGSANIWCSLMGGDGRNLVISAVIWPMERQNQYHLHFSNKIRVHCSHLTFVVLDWPVTPQSALMNWFKLKI